jgi:hypothetical protein
MGHVKSQIFLKSRVCLLAACNFSIKQFQKLSQIIFSFYFIDNSQLQSSKESAQKKRLIKTRRKTAAPALNLRQTADKRRLKRKEKQTP